jgi:hypothetical protein
MEAIRMTGRTPLWLRPVSGWVELRTTQHEQMSSAVFPRTDVGLARPKTLRKSDVMT